MLHIPMLSHVKKRSGEILQLFCWQGGKAAEGKQKDNMSAYRAKSPKAKTSSFFILSAISIPTLTQNGTRARTHTQKNKRNVI